MGCCLVWVSLVPWTKCLWLFAVVVGFWLLFAILRVLVYDVGCLRLDVVFRAGFGIVWMFVVDWLFGRELLFAVRITLFAGFIVIGFGYWFGDLGFWVLMCLGCLRFR